MSERLTEGVKNIITQWRLGDKLEDDGYEDLGRSLQYAVFERIKGLNEAERIKVINVLFPVDK